MSEVKLYPITVAVFALPFDVVNVVAQTSFDSERIVHLVATDIFVIIMRAMTRQASARLQTASMFSKPWCSPIV